MVIERENVEKISIVRINRPEKLNALNTKIILELTALLRELERDDNVKGIILTGTNKSFIAGADINEMKQLNPIAGRNFISNLQKLNGAIRQNKKPVIAAINGYCFGAGLELAVSCDISIASEDALFGMQEVKLGIPSVIEAALFPYIIGLAKTRELLLTGKVIGAREALQIGLVNSLAPKETLIEECVKITREIISNPEWSVTLQKELINRWLENSGLEKSIKVGIDYFAFSLSNEEARVFLKKGV